jgi:hypothetical protein
MLRIYIYSKPIMDEGVRSSIAWQIGAAVVLVSLLFAGSIFAIQYELDNPGTISGKIERVNPVAHKDLQYRQSIASSYCKILLASEQVAINQFDNCVAGRIRDPMSIYRDLTKKQIGEWKDLSMNEKQLVVEAVEVESVRRIESWQMNKAMEEMNVLLQRQFEDAITPDTSSIDQIRAMYEREAENYERSLQRQGR